MKTRFEAYVEEVLDTQKWNEQLTAEEINAARDAMRERLIADMEAGSFMPASMVRRWKLETVED